MPGATSSDWWLLALTLLNTLNFLDRQFLAAVAPRLVKDLQLTNSQLGILRGSRSSSSSRWRRWRSARWPTVVRAHD